MRSFNDYISRREARKNLRNEMNGSVGAVPPPADASGAGAVEQPAEEAQVTQRIATHLGMLVKDLESLSGAAFKNNWAQVTQVLNTLLQKRDVSGGMQVARGARTHLGNIISGK